MNHGLTLSDLPLHMLNNILYRFSDGWDIITLGQVTPTLYTLSEDRQLWKKLCQYHFAEKQVSGWARSHSGSLWFRCVFKGLEMVGIYQNHSWFSFHVKKEL